MLLASSIISLFFYHFLILLNQLNSISTQVIILKGQGRVSSDTMQLIQMQSPKEIGTLSPQEVTYRITDTDVNAPFKIKVQNKNGDIGVGQEEFLSSIRNYKVQRNTSVYMNYSIHSSVIPSASYNTIKEDPSKADTNLNCTYDISEVSFDTIYELAMRTDYTKLQYYSHFLISLDKEKLYQIVNNISFSLSLGELRLPRILNDEPIENFWIVKLRNNGNANNKADELIVLSQTKILVYDIVIINGLFYIELKTSMSRSILKGANKINSVGVYEGHYYFTTTTGIVIVNQYDYVKTLYSSISFTDIIIIYTSIYANAKGKGLYIISLINNNDVNIIPHSSIKQIDAIQNPFTANYFIGLLLDTQSQSDDFYIEYYIPITDESRPILNKVFCSESHHIYSYTTPDLFNSYFLNYNKVYVIRRGMLNKIPSVALALQTHSILNIVSISEYYNQTTNSFQPAFISKNKVYPFNFTEIKHEIQCTASESGKYILIFRHITDACKSNLGKRLKVCAKLNYYYFTVIGGGMTVGRKIGIIVSAVAVGGIAVGVLIYCSYYTGWLKNKSRLRIMQTDKNDRANLYKDTNYNSTEVKGKSKGHNNGQSIQPTEKNNDMVNIQITDSVGLNNPEPVITIGRFVSSRQPTGYALESENRNEQTNNEQNNKITSNINLISIYHKVVASKNVTSNNGGNKLDN